MLALRADHSSRLQTHYLRFWGLARIRSILLVALAVIGTFAKPRWERSGYTNTKTSSTCSVTPRKSYGWRHDRGTGPVAPVAAAPSFVRIYGSALW